MGYPWMVKKVQELIEPLMLIHILQICQILVTLEV